jgi:hypothetical protein
MPWQTENRVFQLKQILSKRHSIHIQNNCVTVLTFYCICWQSPVELPGVWMLKCSRCYHLPRAPKLRCVTECSYGTHKVYASSGCSVHTLLETWTDPYTT